MEISSYRHTCRVRLDLSIVIVLRQGGDLTHLVSSIGAISFVHQLIEFPFVVEHGREVVVGVYVLILLLVPAARLALIFLLRPHFL